jgi:hypothetical protein
MTSPDAEVEVGLIDTKKDDLGGVKLTRNWPQLYVFMRLVCLFWPLLELLPIK